MAIETCHVLIPPAFGRDFDEPQHLCWNLFSIGKLRALFEVIPIHGLIRLIARQVHGSEYSFEPTPGCKWHGRGRIVFHKPHPEPKDEAWRLLGIGERIGKWFGWDANTFELLDTKAC